MEEIPEADGLNGGPANIPEFNKHRPWIKIAVVVLVLAGVGAWGWNYWQSTHQKPKWQELPVGLIADKVSVSANLTINLPPEVKLTAADAASQIVFEPKILGSWEAGKNAQQLVFKPKAKLELAKYYHITLASAALKIEKDFQADEDPKVAAIFPKDGTEANETSEITIEFNRPMVPLTTLDELSKLSLPVKITPSTEGKFKWVTTRTLKFLSATRLHRSSHYTVKVEKGFVSMDGLEVGEASASFTTRPLRYDSDTIHHPGLTLYDEPISIRFNQPVNLEKTAAQIEVKNQETQNKVSVVVEYGTRAVNLGDANNLSEYTDKSVLNIYQNKDRFGRAKFWNNNTAYQVGIKGAVALEGDIKLEESRSVGVQIPNLLESAAAESPRSSLVEPSLFDPKGKLILNFYEEIDKDSSKITAPGLKNIEYGQKCKVGENGEEVRIGPDCEKETNKKQLLLSFSENSFKPGQSFDVELSKVVNVKGLQINGETLKQNVKIYPELQVLRTFPLEGEQGATVTDLVLCTNSPLQDAQPENFYQRLKSNVGVGKWNWEAAFKVLPDQTGVKCAVGQYENKIRYGLQPETKYRIELNLVDQFSQTLGKNLNFTTGKIASIYRKFNSLQKSYSVTSPKATKLTYAVENLEYMDLHVCKVSAAVMLQYVTPETQPNQLTPGQSLNCQQTWSQKINLPLKYWSLNYFQVDLKNIVPDVLGFYVLTLSHPELRDQVYNYKTNRTEPGGQIFERTLLNVTNLAVQEKKVEVQDGQEAERSVERKLLSESQGNLYWVSTIGSLEPVAGAVVQVYQKSNKKYSLSDTAATENSGVARAKPYAGDGAAIITKDNDSTLVSAYSDKFQWAYGLKGGDKTYIYSDRPIYRPGQDVNIKGLYRIGFDGSYEIFTGKPAHLQIFSSKNEPVLTQDLSLSAQGTFKTTYVLPKDAALGTYRVEALDGYYYFDVEEYVPSAFKLDLATDKEEYIAGESFKLNVDANYYFGVPVESGVVEYSVLAQDYYFDRYQDGNFQFGAGWYYSRDPSYGDNFILRGKVPLDSQGKAQISQDLDFDKFFSGDNKTRSKIFVVRATVINSTGQAVSSEKSFIVHRGEFYLGLNLDKPYFGKNEANKILIKSVDTQGKEKGVSNISGRVNKITWEYFKRQEVDGRYYYHSEKKSDSVQSFSTATDSHGNFSKDFTVKDEGEYELIIEAKDSRGNPITAVQDFYVYGPGQVEIRPLNNESLDLVVTQSNVEVGQNVKIIVKSPFTKAKALIAVERGRILNYQILDVDRNFFDYNLTVKEAYLPNFYVTVLLLSPDPQVKFGQAQFFVNTKEKTISVEAKPSKNNYLPGEEVVLNVLTKDSSGQPVPANVSLSVADLSVLALSGNPKKDPVSFFYGGLPLGVTTASNLKNILSEAEIPAGTKGGSGAEPGDLAKKKRGIFKDTAYWNGDVETDASGRAEVKFTLPDNLTTWQVESLGLTLNTKLGVGYQEFQSKKQLMAVPLVPRFVIPGDQFVVGGKIFNQTGSAQKLSVSVSSSSLELSGSKETSIKLDAGQTQTVYFKVKAPPAQTDGSHKVTITAKNSQFEDSVESSFPVKRNETYEAVATSNYTANAEANEYVWLPKNVVKDKGGVQIQASATLAGVLPEALNYLVAYPYGCTEQMVSKIAAVAAVKRFVSLKNLGDKFKLPTVEFDGQTYSADDVVQIGLGRILANQSSEGGFAYYPNMKPDYYLTLNVLDALEQLKKAGYKVDGSAETKAAAYVYQIFNSDTWYNSNKDTLILTAYVLSNVQSASAQFQSLVPRILSLGGNAKFINEDISNLSLVYLALLSTNGNLNILEDKVFNTLENRVVVDGRGSYLGSGGRELFWAYYETPIKDTALLVKALAVAKRNYVDFDKLLRWLKNSRSKDNSWGSTQNTLAVLDATVEYLQFRPETESNFSLDVFLDNNSKGNFTFGSKNILDSFNALIPTGDFTADKLSQIKFSKKNLNNLPNAFYYDMSLRYYLPIDSIAPRDEGFAVERQFYALDDKSSKTSLFSAKVGQVLRGHLKVTVSKQRNFVAVESFIPAGTELVNFNLATEDQSLRQQAPSYGDNSELPPVVQKPAVKLERPGFFSRVWMAIKSPFHRKSGPSVVTSGELPDEVYSGKNTERASLIPDSTEYHYDRLMLFNQQLAPGVYEYDYFVRALIPGKFQYLPAVASELYLPENFGRTGGGYFEIKQ